MKKVLALFSFIVFMSSCVTYKVDRIPYDSDKAFKDIIDSKSVILISELVYSDSINKTLISKGQPKIIKDFKIVEGVISGVIDDAPELIKHGKGDRMYDRKNPYFNIKYFREGELLEKFFNKREFRKAKEVVYLTTHRKLGYGPFKLRLEDLENGTENTAATYKVNYPLSVAKGIGYAWGGFIGIIIIQMATFDGIHI
jgi:tetrahydromethanopterin S-methyltransferase subunit G